jgi:glutamate-ammonia-ligase adenylyltransferase
LGPGGLSDVEWTVQLLQLRHGGQHPGLRRPGALAAIAALVEEGLLSEDDGRWLTDGWILLAGVRNALYLGGARETSLLPSAPEQVERLARTLGYDRPGGQHLSEDVARAMRRVRKVHERCFYDDHRP